MTTRKLPIAIGSAIVLSASAASAATYQVGPTRSFTTVTQVLPSLQPGDVVEIDGNATYPGDLYIETSGTAAQPITFKGIRVNGSRPVFSGGTNTIHYYASNLVFEGLDVTGGSSRCIFHHGNNVTIKDTVVHDCPNHGILGADDEAGSLTLDYVEVHHAGSGDSHHPIYMATDEVVFPGSVFRMQHCWVHDGNGGNNVKSRAERNEIYSNWIEGPVYHDIELIGPDGADEDIAREDSDVVGNVFVKLNSGYMSREGGDGTGETWGRYRFVNNTFVVGPTVSAIFRLYDGIESLEMHNNAIIQVGAGGPMIIHDSDASWSTGAEIIGGSNNWVSTGATVIPSTWADTMNGLDAGLLSLVTDDVELATGSPLVDQGDMAPTSPSGFAFPNPLALPADLPPLHAIQALGTAQPRNIVGPIDVGAFELGGGSGSSTTSTSSTGSSDPTTTSGSTGSGDSSGAGGSTSVGATTGSGSGETTGSGSNTTSSTSSGSDETTSSSASGDGTIGFKNGEGGGDVNGDASGNGAVTGSCAAAPVGSGAPAELGTIFAGLAIVASRLRRRVSKR